MPANTTNLEKRLWDVACAVRGASGAPKHKEITACHWITVQPS